MATTHTITGNEEYIIFAGAGVSMAPPTSLPGWNALNDAILDTLWDMLPQYGIKDTWREKILGSIRQHRDANQFPPDYQAQLMAERAGIRYFELLSAVDADAYNAIHYYTALLARTGTIKAVITTNFDRNFERAFEAVDVPYEAYYDEAGFNKLANNNAGPVAIIKIHGSCTAPASLIDTRQQRLKGRAKALQTALGQLMHQHPLIFAGFSGADFDDDKNYLGFWDAATNAKGFTYLNRPGSEIRPGMQAIIDQYGHKANAQTIDAATWFEQQLQAAGTTFQPFAPGAQPTTPIREKLQAKVAALEPMDAINMLTALAESYGDEVSARYLYDKAWGSRFQQDYEGEALSRFLLNHGRSYVFNFQDKIERANSAGVIITQSTIGEQPPGLEEVFTNPAKMNLKHQENTSPETPGLIALAQTFLGNPILFSAFPKGLGPYFRREPSVTEMADIIYYYSWFALIYGELENVGFLHYAINEMEVACDEPRLAQLLCRRAMMKLQLEHPEVQASAKDDIQKAHRLAEKYHEPHLLAHTALVMAMAARRDKQFTEALQYIQQAQKGFETLNRIPQYMETMVEYLKILLLGFATEAVSKQFLLTLFQQIDGKVSGDYIRRIAAYEPEYCFHGALLLGNYTTAPREQVISWFADACYRAEITRQERNAAHYRSTCQQLELAEDVEALVTVMKKQTEG